MRRGQLSHFSVLLDPDDDADDYLRLQLSVCSGNAELWAKLDAPVSVPSHDFTSSPPLLQPIVLQPSNLAGRSKVFAAIHGKDSISSTFCLDARPANELPAEHRLSKANGALTLSNDGKLAVHIMALVPLAGEVPLADVSADPRAVTYEVWTAFNTSNLVFTSWCGIEQGQGQQLLSVRGSELARPGPDGKLVLPLPAPKKATPGCNSSCGLVFGQVYLLSVVAVYQPSSSALPARFIYQSVAWKPGSRHGGNGAGRTVLILFVFMLLIGGGAAAYVYRERLPRTTADLAELVSLIKLPRVRRAAAGGEAMNVPLATSGYQHQPPLSAPLTTSSFSSLHVETSSEATSIPQPAAEAPLERREELVVAAAAPSMSPPAASSGTSTTRYNERMARARARTSAPPRATTTAQPSTAHDVMED